jgi:hypothetical protein
LYEFHEGAFRLFDPVADESEARFPHFIKRQPCPWGGKDWESLGPDLQTAFVQTRLPIAKIITSDPNEARDLFIRLQAGMPLTAQEKRDAWPGNFTDFVLKIGGKPEIARYPGHEFFSKLMGARITSGRGKLRQLAAQMAMLFFRRKMGGEARFFDINSRAIDDFYYENLEFDASSPMARRFVEVLDKLAPLLGDSKRKKLIGHEAIHLVLLVDALLDDYTRSWEGTLPEAFDQFRQAVARDKLTKGSESPGEFWVQYSSWTQASTDIAENIRRRHEFFCRKMLGWLCPQLKDTQRSFGALEREVIYYRDKKRCQVCDADVTWEDAEIHHVQGHATAGPTTLDNAVLVHGHCHPRGGAAEEFAERFHQKKVQQPTLNDSPDPMHVWSLPEGEGPRIMRIGSDSYRLGYSYEILLNTAEWLIKNGKLKTGECPVSVARGNRYLINTEPKHRDERPFTGPKKLSNGLWIERAYGTQNLIDYAKRLLEKSGYPSDMLEVQ